MLLIISGYLPLRCLLVGTCEGLHCGSFMRCTTISSTSAGQFTSDHNSLSRLCTLQRAGNSLSQLFCFASGCWFLTNLQSACTSGQVSSGECYLPVWNQTSTSATLEEALGRLGGIRRRSNLLPMIWCSPLPCNLHRGLLEGCYLCTMRVTHSMLECSPIAQRLLRCMTL